MGAPSSVRVCLFFFLNFSCRSRASSIEDLCFFFVENQLEAEKETAGEPIYRRHRRPEVETSLPSLRERPPKKSKRVTTSCQDFNATLAKGSNLRRLTWRRHVKHTCPSRNRPTHSTRILPVHIFLHSVIQASSLLRIRRDTDDGPTRGSPRITRAHSSDGPASTLGALSHVSDNSASVVFSFSFRILFSPSV